MGNKMKYITRKKYNIGYTEHTFSHRMKEFQNKLSKYGSVTINHVNNPYKKMINLTINHKKYLIIIEEKNTNKSNTTLEVTFNFNRDNIELSDKDIIIPKVENVFSDMFTDIKITDKI